MKIYIHTDLEGVCGVFSFEQSRNRVREARESLMYDLRACVEGLREAGVDEILASDAHGPGMSFIPELMPEGVPYMMGKPRPRGLYGLDDTFHGLIMLGQHAMMGTEDGVLNHTGNSKTEKRLWYNGVESGEIGYNTMLAGHFGVPLIMITGDEATCREAKDFAGDQVTTVAVKKGISRESALLYPSEEARKDIKAGAIAAIRNIGKYKPCVTQFPLKAKFTDKTGVVVEKEVSSIFEITNFYVDEAATREAQAR